MPGLLKNNQSKILYFKYSHLLHYSLYFSAPQTFQKFILRCLNVKEVWIKPELNDERI